MFAAYSRLNTSHPVLTKSAVSATLSGAADLVCQRYESRSQETDWHRTARMSSWGLLVNAPAGHFFYAALDRLIQWRGSSAVALKIAVDQLIFTPPLTVGFFLFQELASGGGAASAVEAAATETVPTLLYNWTFWSVAHVITFTFVPLEHRVAWVALKNFTWSGFLSWRLSRLRSQPGEDGARESQLKQRDAHSHPARLLKRNTENASSAK
jgi:protein Mpv17